MSSVINNTYFVFLVHDDVHIVAVDLFSHFCGDGVDVIVEFFDIFANSLGLLQQCEYNFL